MEYIGAADYYFWQGVLNGLFESQDVNIDSLDIEFPMDNETTRACVEAYKWGVCFGREMTEEEYFELTEPKVKTKEKEELEVYNTQMIGTC